MDHVGVNCLFLVPGETGGMEVALRGLLPALREAAPAVRFTALVNAESRMEDFGVEQVVLPVRARHRPAWVFGDQALVPRVAARLGCDVVHSPGGLGPLWGAFTHVVTIHDLHYRTHRDAHFGLRGLGMHALVPAVARRATRVITGSEHSRAQLEQFLHLRREKIDVVPHGVIAPGDRPAATPERQLRADLRLDDRPLLLALSAKRPHKNLANLLEAVASLDRRWRPCVVLPGYATPHETALRERVRALDLEGHVRFTGWISDADVEGLLNMASVFVHPAFDEGFGLPVLEAMAHGVPVACSRRPPLTDLARGCAAFFDPSDPADMAGAIQSLLIDAGRARELAAAGRRRAAEFSWQATAQATLESYARALSWARDGRECGGRN